MTTKILLVGGPQDGEWKSIDINQSVIRVAVPRHHYAMMTGDSAPDIAEKAFDEAIYRKRRLRDERGSDFPVMVADDCDLVSALIDGYRVPR